MIVTLIAKNKIDSLTLPEKVRGQFWLQWDRDGHFEKLISIEALDGGWVLKSNRKVRVINDSGKPVRSTGIEPLRIYLLQIENSDERVVVFTEASTVDRQKYTKYILDRDDEVSIGRDSQNDIVVANQFISSKHAQLAFREGKWSIYDNNSTNGTFVNGERIKSKNLDFGDVVWLMGFKLVIGNFFIAINNPDNNVKLLTDLLTPFESQKVEKKTEEDEEEDSEALPIDYFYRSPRFKRDIDKPIIKIDSPPQNAIGDEIPFILLIGPSMTMGIASMTTAIFAINNAISSGNIKAALPSIVMSGSMLLGTVMWPVVSKRFEKRRKRRKEALRQKKYKEYLDRISMKFKEECEKQEEILRENFPMIQDSVSRITHAERNLWERGLGQNDFLEFRVGLGSRQLIAEISYSGRKFTIDEDNLQEELFSVCETPKILNDVPITFSVFEDYVSGVIGNRKAVIEFIKGLVIQVSAFYSYDEVKLVFIYNKTEESDFEFAKWLPHVWSNDRKFRFIATDTNEAKEVSASLERELVERSMISDNDIEEITPYYIVVALDKALSDKTDVLKQIYAKKKNLHFSVLNCYDELKNLPKECTMVIELGEDSGKLFDKNDISGKAISFLPDIFLPTDAHELSVKLANVQLDVREGSYMLPKMMTFLEMFGVGKVEHLNSLTRWKENNPTQSLQAAVGVDTSGELFSLDLHEKFHGPHGLVAGMTGSGKSEFIITYILSLAVNYHPNEVAFILIDYKGGGMAKSFENLPHTAGIITNLDGASIKRSLISIQSELKRRQALFAKAGKDVGVSNIDIYKYQRLFREGTVDEPLQHLFIISDEFAELKTQQPEFMTQLVSAARIGRSLGVHLILATQKPAGVVDDQIWSNSKFRVCLKVQERADSMDMLKRPDAAGLTDTGRFYLQVGYNELFEMGQSSWAGAPYYPSDKVLVEKDNSVVVIDRNGRPIREARIDSRKNLNANPPKQLDVITEYLRTIAEEEKIKIRTLWLDPIPALILLESVIKKFPAAKERPYVLNPIIGEYDDPARQQQCVLRVPLSEEGNVAVLGVAGSGKTTFLNTLVYSLITNHTPDEVNIYLLDFASETLRAFAKAPHVGDVVLSFEAEKISNLFKMLRKEMDRRKKLFADYGGDYASYFSSTGQSVPSIIVAINNFAAFTEIYQEKEEAVSFLTREGTKYGLYFILTAPGTGAIRFRLLQNFKQIFVLQLNDESDYSTLLGKTEGLYPSKHKGRGLVKRDGLYEFQIAHITEEKVPFSFIQKHSAQANSEWKGTGALKIPILPEQVDAEFLMDYVEQSKLTNFPIGVEKHSLRVYSYPFGMQYINQILSAGQESANFAYDFSLFLSKAYHLDVTFFDPLEAFHEKDSKTIAYYSKAKECEKAVSELFDLVLFRNNLYKDSLEKNEKCEPFEQKVVIINSVIALKSILSEETKEKLNLALEKGNVKYAIMVIIAEPAKNIASISFDKWYKQHISPGDGIWVGGGISEQYQLKPTKTTSEMRDDMPFGFGFAVQKGKAVNVKLLTCEKGDSDDDE
jgi:S-DNA-T family DNA segregation ATPase FtsK/SpoIIIE